MYARLLSIWSVIAAPRAAPRAARKLDIWLDYEYVQSLLRQQAVQEQENLTFQIRQSLRRARLSSRQAARSSLRGSAQRDTTHFEP